LLLNYQKYGFGIRDPEKTPPGSRGQKSNINRSWIQIRNTTAENGVEWKEERFEGGGAGGLCSYRSDNGDVPGSESCILHLRRLDGVERDGEDQGEEPRVHTCNQGDISAVV
jgi:hypothetical protein